MSKLRKKPKPFGSAPNDLLNDDRISFKAKGIFCFIESKQDGWEFSEERIAIQTKDGVASVRSGIQELIQFGYLKREFERNEKGHVKSEYILEWKPTFDFPRLENPTLENHRHISKKEYSKKKNIYKKRNSTTTPSNESNREEESELTLNKLNLNEEELRALYKTFIHDAERWRTAAAPQIDQLIRKIWLEKRKTILKAPYGQKKLSSITMQNINLLRDQGYTFADFVCVFDQVFKEKDILENVRLTPKFCLDPDQFVKFLTAYQSKSYVFGTKEKKQSKLKFNEL